MGGASSWAKRVAILGANTLTKALQTATIIPVRMAPGACKEDDVQLPVVVLSKSETPRRYCLQLERAFQHLTTKVVRRAGKLGASSHGLWRSRAALLERQVVTQCMHIGSACSLSGKARRISASADLALAKAHTDGACLCMVLKYAHCQAT